MTIEHMNERALQLARQALAEGLPGEPPDRFLFLTLSGAHLYGFPSTDSDLDIRGAHILPVDAVIGLRKPDETYSVLEGEVEGVELDCVSHDVGKYLRLLTHKNGYVLEQIFSPLVVFDSGDLDELRHLAQGAITKHVAHHYRGFLRNQIRLANREDAPRVKTILYLFRVAMTGIHLLRTGEVEANIRVLNAQVFKRSDLPELMERKMASGERSVLSPRERARFVVEVKHLEAELETAAAASPLPDDVENREAINDFLVRRCLQT